MNRSFSGRSGCDRRNGHVARTVLLVMLVLLARVAHADDGDHDRARRAVEAGEILPLARIVAIAEASFEGRMVDVELEKDDGRFVYELELLTTAGHVIELTYDARTGALLETEGRGVDAARRRP